MLRNLHGYMRSPRDTKTVCNHFKNVYQERNTALGRIQDSEKGDLDTERRVQSATGAPGDIRGASFPDSFLKLRSSKMEFLAS